MLVGSTGISTRDQYIAFQRDALKAAGTKRQKGSARGLFKNISRRAHTQLEHPLNLGPTILSLAGPYNKIRQNPDVGSTVGVTA